MKTVTKQALCALLSLILLVGGVLSVAADNDYIMSSTRLRVGDNVVSASVDETTIFKFKPTKVGYYRVTVDHPDAVFDYWYGSAQYVSMASDTMEDGTLIVTCSAVGQTLLIGLSGVETATITIAEEPGYVAPPKVVYTIYENKHRISRRFSMPKETLTAVDITKPQTLVADSQGIYHLGTADGPIVYVNTRASIWTDLYKLFYPDDVEGEEWPPISNMRGRYAERNGKIFSYEFVDAMAEYADAVDKNGYYYLTVDLAMCMQYFGHDQGWYEPEYSPFAPIQQGKFIEESAWLVNTYYVAPDVTLGDVNGDGQLNNRDLGLLQKYLNDWDVTVDEAAADLNGDGKHNNRDLSELQKLLNH